MDNAQKMRKMQWTPCILTGNSLIYRVKGKEKKKRGEVGVEEVGILRQGGGAFAQSQLDPFVKSSKFQMLASYLVQRTCIYYAMKTPPVPEPLPHQQPTMSENGRERARMGENGALNRDDHLSLDTVRGHDPPPTKYPSTL